MKIELLQIAKAAKSKSFTFFQNSEADSELAQVWIFKIWEIERVFEELIWFLNSKNGGVNICKLYKMDSEYYEFDIFHSRFGDARRRRVDLPPGFQL